MTDPTVEGEEMYASTAVSLVLDTVAMIVGASTVIYAAWLMHEKGWREEDED